MADYYPLVARAVAGLERNTGDARRALYERARAALVAQLRSAKPPISEGDITRERLALEDALRTVETQSVSETLGLGRPLRQVRAPEMPKWDLPTPRSRIRTSPFEYTDPFAKPDPLAELALLLEGTGVTPSRYRPEQPSQDMARLRRALPEQKLAPAQFEIRNGRLALKDVRSTPAPEDRNNVVAAREELKSGGERILRELERSNCDRRLIETVQAVQGLLSEEGNVIRLGISNIQCATMCATFESELPDAITSMLRGHSLGIEMYVAQFPEWNRFVENAAQVQLAESDIGALHKVVAELIDSMEKQPQLVEPEVPKLLLYLNELIRDPKKSSKRAAFAVLRSVGNLINNVFTWASEAAEKTTKAAVGALVAGLLMMALTSALSISPIAGKINEMQWLRTAIEVVQKELEKLGR